MSHPYGKIITIDEGEVGLPHKMFYSLDNNHKVTCFNSYEQSLQIYFHADCKSLQDASERFRDKYG